MSKEVKQRTAVSLSVVVLIGGMIWRCALISSMGEANQAALLDVIRKQDQYNAVLQDVEIHLSRIEGKLDVVRSHR